MIEFWVVVGIVWLFGHVATNYRAKRHATKPSPPQQPTARETLQEELERLRKENEALKGQRPTKQATKERSGPTAPVRAASPIAADVQDVEINEDFRAALSLIEQGRSLFVTGKAGTGKSTLLRYFRATTKRSVAVVAPTGLAAINVGGQTLHSFFKFAPRLIDPDRLPPSRNADVLQRLDTLVVDEVSMVRADLMDGVDRILRATRRRPDVPFGGVQVLLIGDLFQLPPIVREHNLKEYFAQRYGSPYFFRAPAFSATRMPVLDLQKVYRQTDPTFIDILNAIRVRNCNPDTLKTLNDRVCSFDQLDHPDTYVTLTPTNDAAHQINTAFLDRLPDREHLYPATVDGKFEESAYPTDASLRLKVGARVMLLRNDREKRWVNGTLATITHLSPGKIKVRVNGTQYEVQQHSWENVEYYFDKEQQRVSQRIIGTFQQFPLRLAWALTIHKSQGQTFDRIYLDLGSGAFAHGQTYVALSRCRSLDGIRLSRPVFTTDVILDETIYGYQSVFETLPTSSTLQ